MPVGVDADLVVVGAEALGDDVGVLELVALDAADRFEADGEGRQPVLAGLGEQADDQAGVDAARQQAPDGHVGHQPALDGDAAATSRTASSQSCSDQSARLVAAAEVRFPVGRRRCVRPSGSIATSDAGGTLVTPRRIVRGGGTTEWKRQVVVQRDGVDPGVDVAAGEQRGQRRREAHAVRSPRSGTAA